MLFVCNKHDGEEALKEFCDICVCEWLQVHEPIDDRHLWDCMLYNAFTQWLAKCSL